MYTTVVSYRGMRNITLSADETVIEAALARACAENTTLNDAFRRWLASYARRDRQVVDALALIDEISSYTRTGGHTFSREEPNERN